MRGVYSSSLVTLVMLLLKRLQRTNAYRVGVDRIEVVANDID